MTMGPSDGAALYRCRSRYGEIARFIGSGGASLPLGGSVDGLPATDHFLATGFHLDSRFHSPKDASVAPMRLSLVQRGSVYWDDVFAFLHRRADSELPEWKCPPTHHGTCLSLYGEARLPSVALSEPDSLFERGALPGEDNDDKLSIYLDMISVDALMAGYRLGSDRGVEMVTFHNAAQTARTCIYGHLEEHHVIDPAVSHLEMDDNVPGREHELGRPRHAMSVMSALAL